MNDIAQELIVLAIKVRHERTIQHRCGEDDQAECGTSVPDSQTFDNERVLPRFTCVVIGPPSQLLFENVSDTP